MIVTAALYARVSTPNQEEEDTIDSQVAAIERYIQDHGYDLPSEFYFLDKSRQWGSIRPPCAGSAASFSFRWCFCNGRLLQPGPFIT